MTNSNSEQAGWRQHIVSTPEVLGGKPRIDGTRIPVALILGYLAAGERLRRNYQGVSRSHARRHRRVPRLRT